MTTITQNGNNFEVIPHIGPQIIMVFIPNFETKKVGMRQLILSDDWVADCQKLDEKYGVWFTTPQQAKTLLG